MIQITLNFGLDDVFRLDTAKTAHNFYVRLHGPKGPRITEGQTFGAQTFSFEIFNQRRSLTMANGAPRRLMRMTSLPERMF